MLWRQARFWIVAALLLALNAAGIVWLQRTLAGGHRPLLRVLSVLPTQDLEDADRISVVFHEPIVGPEAIGSAPAAPLLTMKPDPGGRWEWAAPDRLEYVLAARLPAGHAYRITPAADVEQHTGRALFGQTEFRLATAPLTLREIRVQSVEPEAATLELEFNQPVLPADLLKYIEVRDAKPGAAAASVRCLEQTAAATLAIRAQTAAESLRVMLRAGLTGSGAQLGLERDLTRSVELPRRFGVLGVSMWGDELAEEQTARIRLSRPLRADQPTPKVQVTPAVEGLAVSTSGSVIEVTGPFRSGVTYRATVPAEVLAADGSVLGASQSVEFVPPDRSPQIRSVFRAGVLSPSGHRQLDLRMVNVPGVRIRAERVYANTLATHLAGSWAPTTREVAEKTIKLDLARNQPTDIALDLRSIIGDGLGVYRIETESTQSRWVDDTTTVAITDMAITSKRGRDGILAWVTSISTGRPVAGAQVKVLTRSNQALAAAETGSDGLARLPITPKHPDGAAWLVVAEQGDDLAYLKLGGAADLFDDVDQSGREAPTTYDAFVYSDRGIYRPGETVQISGILRDARGGRAPQFPLEVTVVRPDGREIAEVITTPGAEGFFHAAYTVPESGHTGRYRFRLGLPGAEESLGETAAWIEAFVPARIEVKIAPEGGTPTGDAALVRFGPGEPARLAVDARYLFGQPASSLGLEVSGTHTRAAFTAAGYEGFSFDAPSTAKEVIDAGKSQLSEDGTAIIVVPPPRSKERGLWRSVVSATVTEVGGRSVSATTQMLIDTAERHLGLRLPGSIVPVGIDTPLEWALVAPDGSPAIPAGPITVRIFRVETEWSLEVVNDRPVWKPIERETLAEERQTAPNGARGSTPIRFTTDGSFRLRASDSAGAEAVLEVVAADSATGADMALSRPQRIELKPDKDAYVPGETARVLVRSPFPGTLLLTLECDGVIFSQVREMTGETTAIEIPIDPTVRGSAYVAAAVVRAVDASRDRWLPARAAGLARLVIDHAPQKLAVSIETPAEARPGETIRVRVTTPPPADGAGPAVVHLWAVDDGILLTGAYALPDPFGHFLGARRLAVESDDGYRDLLPDYTRAADITRIGGDGGDEDDVTRSPVPMRRRAPALLWRTAEPVDADGSLTVELPMPDLLGRLRIMAVAAAADHYGAAQATVTLAAPLVAEVSWPRFIAPGDRALVPIKLINATGHPLTTTITATATGVGRVTLRNGNAQIAANTSTVIWATLEATEPGSIDVAINAAANSPDGTALTAHADAAIPARAAAGFDSRATVLRAEPGVDTPITLDDRFLPESTRVEITIAPGPETALRPAIDALIEYPHGCVEQVSSRVYALLAARSVLQDAEPERAAMVDSLIDSGIARLWSMQTTDGGLAYWPGSRDATVWGSAYAAELLLCAAELGRPVDPKFTTMLADYLDRQLAARDEDVDDNLRAQICAVLAATDRPRPGWIAMLTERADKLDLGGRASLMLALHRAGDDTAALRILGDDPLSSIGPRTASGRLTSPIAQTALLLETLVEIEPLHPLLPLLAQRLVDERTNGAWGSTLDDAAAIRALSAYAAATPAGGHYTGGIVAGDTTTALSSSLPSLVSLSGKDLPAVVRIDGDAAATVVVRMTGRLREPAPPADRGLRIRRTWTDRAGNRIDPANLRIGDLIMVRTSIVGPGLGDTTAQNIAIVDMLPAGVEVENPALATAIRIEDSGPKPAAPDRTEFLDDRVVLFTDVTATPREFVYMLRVTTPGAFTLPPIQAASMYDPALFSSHGGGTVEIVP